MVLPSSFHRPPGARVCRHQDRRISARCRFGRRGRRPGRKAAQQQQLLGLLDRNVDGARVAIDPPVLAQGRILALTELKNLVGRNRLQPRSRGQAPLLLGRERELGRGRRIVPVVHEPREHPPHQAMRQQRGGSQPDGKLNDEPDVRVGVLVPRPFGGADVLIVGRGVCGVVMLRHQWPPPLSSDSRRYGSPAANSSRCFNCVKNIHTHSPPIASGAARSVKYRKKWLACSPVSECRFLPSDANSGVTSMYMSASRTKINHSATVTSRCEARLILRDSSSRNGTAKWKIVRNSARYCQPFRMRVVMYGISSVRFAANVNMYCEKLKYA